MGGMAIVVVGDDWRDQPDRYQSLEHAEASNRHIVTVDRLPAALKAYPWATKSRIRLPDGREVDNFDEIKSAQMCPPSGCASCTTRSTAKCPSRNGPASSSARSPWRSAPSPISCRSIALAGAAAAGSRLAEPPHLIRFASPSQPDPTSDGP